MSAVIYTPTSPEEAIEIRVDGVLYTFVAGVPQDVPEEHLSAVTTALGSTGTTTSGHPAEL